MAQRAFPLFARAARAGIAEAEFRVGRCYLEGAGVPPSRAGGRRWLERAANQGYVEAQALLAGSMSARARARPRRRTASRRAARPVLGRPSRASPISPARGMGAPGGRGRLGRRPGGARLHPDLRPGGDARPRGGASLVRDGPPRPARRRARSATPCRWRATPTTPGRPGADGREHLRQAAERACRPRSTCLAMLTERGVGVPSAIRRRRRNCYRQAAEKGNRNGQARWGLALMEGRGVEPNPVGGRVLAAARGAGRRSGSRGAGRRSLRQGRQAAAELCRGGDVVPPRRGGGARGAARALGLLHLTGAGRAARPGGGGALVPHLRRGRRSQRAGRSRQLRAARARATPEDLGHAPANGSSRPPRPATWSPPSISASAWPRASASSGTSARPRNGCAAPPTAW